MAKEEVELQEAADQHKVMVTVSEPDHPMVSKRKETVMKRVVVSAPHKDHAVAKAKEFYKKRGYKVHDAEYHSAVPKSTLATEQAEIDEKKLTPAELKKREEIAKAMERENPGMDMSRKMAIATAAAKRVAEEWTKTGKTGTHMKLSLIHI